MITLVLGGARSGKSAVAERLAADLPPPLTYVATGTAVDDEMTARIAAHRLRRPVEWATVEVGADLPEAVGRLQGSLLIDSLGTWVAAVEGLAAAGDELAAALRGRDAVVVSDEVGLGVHPSTDLGRRFRDRLGEVNRAVADGADSVLLVVAGRVLRLEQP
ncbi:MAG TPA: bifunctional adenosylcobinamide kinase/adenosylcobinamide-phosphate guanylyltransferase [Acidimicrobiales bacterium]|jgi:adenosyl cobinamide kinase/adenosyl cobinamide phosphate guanylyltransferase|nr:bifunctional adenosylcobinamide kinase/adenosylcobinamide-phosphate guanylyltransferase [Acidimicrobiales bacterium]